MAKRTGRTRNITLARKREAKENLTIEVDPYISRIVGKDSQYFISESGCVVRKFGRLNVEKWSRMEVKDRDNIYKTVTVIVAPHFFGKERGEETTLVSGFLVGKKIL